MPGKAYRQNTAAGRERIRMNQKTKFIRRVAEAGFDDVLLLSRSTAEEVLTEKRMELLNEIATDDLESMRDLGRRVDRDISIVKRDLDILYEAGVVEYEQNGRAKRPVLAHKNVFVKPVVFEGEPMEDATNHTSEIAAD
jgi:predicted transcriptional regulator